MLRESNDQKEHGSQKEALPRGTAFGLIKFHDLAYLGSTLLPFLFGALHIQTEY